ncbi:twin-arginine translocation signal domain-containing protein [Sphingobium nicotianae]|uniref:Twin-arginine translocation signal domain-containing protein n=1 Tax=Sphingobium nicotianae TaxID=2782607 RepID=A0A9X1DBS5_9SPHN|nr:twin-arginine translocation signal domain-containing protein [Sphingobium nicotianae]MBT2187014.1 twin-arginine translocation signal domain-containing protein [Sphingobium nicotianae]
MSVSRRQVLGGAAVLGAAGAIGVQRMTGPGKVAHVVLFDSRKPASLAFARTRAGKRQLDLAHTANWSAIRTIDRKGAVAGMTSWNDYVSARQWLEERGLRVQSERHDKTHDLIEWVMA